MPLSWSGWPDHYVQSVWAAADCWIESHAKMDGCPIFAQMTDIRDSARVEWHARDDREAVRRFKAFQDLRQRQTEGVGALMWLLWEGTMAQEGNRPERGLAGTVNSDSPDSEKGEGGAK